MIKTYLINLEKDRDRLHHMQEQLLRAGIQFSRIEAVNGRKIKDEHSPLWNHYLESRKTENNNISRELTCGEIGCSFSHQLCYKDFLASGAEYALIMEDDLLIEMNFKTIFEDIVRINNSGNNWNLIQFSYTDFSRITTIFCVCLSLLKKEIIKIKNNFRIFNLVRLFAVPIFNFFIYIREYIGIHYIKGLRRNIFRNQPGTGCYMIDRRAAERLILINSGALYSADNAIVDHLFKHKDIKCFSYYPQMVKQNLAQFSSSIDQMQSRA
jgi:GR25 family glycosyltransferase involved in LPS biosynthesis